MRAVQFLDTNVLLYAVSTARAEVRKKSRAREVLDDTDLGLSVQVLQEFYVQATRPTRPDRLSHRQAASLVESWLRFTVAETTIEILQASLATAERHKLAYWDAAIIESARALGCRTVLSEDLTHGRNFDGVVVLNPFRD
jgi:predicted nucleic acid-binding protein